MKRKIMGVLAIAIAIGITALTAVKKVDHRPTLVWFKISGTIAPGTDVPKADASFINTGSEPTSDESCSGETYQCVSGFNTDQVSGMQLKDNNEAPVEQPYMHD